MSVEHVAGKNVGKIMLYALSTCGWCRKTRDLLESLGVEYDYVYVDLLSGEDRERTINAGRGGRGNEIRLEEGLNYVFLLSSKYADVFRHHVQTKRGVIELNCLGGHEAEGWAPDDCLICTRQLKHYRKKK